MVKIGGQFWLSKSKCNNKTGDVWIREVPRRNPEQGALLLSGVGNCWVKCVGGHVEGGHVEGRKWSGA